MHWLSTLALGLRAACSFRVDRHKPARAPKVTRATVDQVKKAGKPKKLWLLDIDGAYMRATAHTKSEARADFKRQLSASSGHKWKRLPEGVSIQRAMLTAS